jgi:serine/threonine protein kinase/tetratricopeptide (TPR) repeat protein
MLGPAGDTKLSERFLREARALRKLRHQHTVTVYDLDRSVPGLTYMVMEMVEGHSLREDLRLRGRLTLEEVIEVAKAVCDALTAAHERGIIHRDLKPDNILRAQEETVSGHILRTIKIADFGIVKLKGSQQGGDASMQLTQYGAPIGTPFYMSPEQWFGDGPGITALDHRTDIYALGCTLYELLAGRPPFIGHTPPEMRQQHLHDEPPPLYTLASHVPLPVSRVIMRALSKDRDERQQTATEFFEELRAAYDESFRRTDPEMDELLGSTQASMSSEASAGGPTSLIDTEESVPMFTEKVVALDPSLLNTEQGHAASIDLQSTEVAAEAGTTTPFSSTDFPSVQGHSQDPVLEHAGQAFEYRPATVHPNVKRRSRRKLWLVVGSVLLLLGAATAIGLAVYLHRTRQTSVASESMKPPQAQFKSPEIPMSALVGTLRVKAAPGSEVFIDDEKAGTTGTDGFFNIEVPVGLRNVRVVAKGYRPWSRDARVKANEQATLSAARERPPEVEEGTADKRQDRAREASDKKDYDAAEAEYRAMLKDDPDNAATHARLGLLLNQQQRYAEAIEELEATARLDPKDTETRQTLVKLYLLKNRDADAEAMARQLVRLAPRDPYAHYWLARTLLRVPDKQDEGLSEIAAALKIREMPQFLETKAYLLLMRDSRDDALATARRAVKLEQSKNSYANAAVAVVLYRMDNVSEAVDTYRQLRQADKSDRWGDLKGLQLQRAYSQPVLDTLASLIARTNLSGR